MNQVKNFDLKLVKKIANKAINGRIVTTEGKTVTLTTFEGGNYEYPLEGYIEGSKVKHTWSIEGGCGECYDNKNDLFIEVSYNIPEHSFETFDKVIGIFEDKYGYERWHADFYSHEEAGLHYGISGRKYTICLPWNEKTARLNNTREPATSLIIKD